MLACRRGCKKPCALLSVIGGKFARGAPSFLEEGKKRKMCKFYFRQHWESTKASLPNDKSSGQNAMCAMGSNSAPLFASFDLGNTSSIVLHHGGKVFCIITPLEGDQNILSV